MMEGSGTGARFGSVLVTNKNIRIRNTGRMHGYPSVLIDKIKYEYGSFWILNIFLKIVFLSLAFSADGRLRAQTKRSVSDPDHLPWVYHFVSDKTNALHTRTSFAKNNHSHTGVLLNICCVWHYKNLLSLYLNFKGIMNWIFFFLYHLKKSYLFLFLSYFRLWKQAQLDNPDPKVTPMF